MELKSFLSHSLKWKIETRHDNDSHRTEYEYPSLSCRHKPPPAVEPVVPLEALIVSCSHEEAILHHRRVVPLV